MNKLIRTSALALLFLAAAAAGQTGAGQARQQAPPPPRPLEEKPLDPGRLVGETYSNDFFGMSLSMPKGWVVQDSAQRRAIIEMGKDAITANADAGKKARMESAAARANVLFSVMKHSPYAVTAGFNAHFACVAERVPTAIVRDGADYIQLSLNIAQGSPVRMELMAPVRSERIGGRTFAVADLKTTLPGSIAAQKYYATITNGYALTFIYTYADEADLRSLKTILGSVAFKPAGRSRR